MSALGTPAASRPTYGPRLGRRHRPPKRTDYHRYRNCLRLDYQYTCAYCLAREAEVGPSDPHGGFEIEHFKPKGRREFRRLKSSYDNLLWTCELCNRAKGSSWPTPREAEMGFRFIDPSREPLAEHLVVQRNRVATVDDSSAGQFMIDEINLNSAAHQHRRERREKLQKLYATISQELEIEARSNTDRDTISTLHRSLEQVREELGDALPWDAPQTCACETRDRKPR